MAESATNATKPAPTPERPDAEAPSLEDIITETQTSRVAEEALLDYVQNLRDGHKIIEERGASLAVLRRMALKATEPTDWILFKDQEGAENAMLAASGSQKIESLYGLEIIAIRPTTAKGNFEPEKIDYGNGVYELRGWLDAKVKKTGVTVMNMEFSRRSDEDFAGRRQGEDGHLTRYRAGSVAAEGDLRKSTYTSGRTRAMRIGGGFTRVSLRELAEAWEGTKKSVTNCRHGHGYGTGAQRSSGGEGAAIGASKDTFCPENFGPADARGKNIKEISEKAAQWYIAAAAKTLADKAKANYHAKETKWKAALEAELERRKGAEPREPGQDDEPPHPAEMEE